MLNIGETTLIAKKNDRSSEVTGYGFSFFSVIS